MIGSSFIVPVEKLMRFAANYGPGTAWLIRIR